LLQEGHDKLVLGGVVAVQGHLADARFRGNGAGARRPQALADGLLLLMDGAYLAARMYGASPDNPGAGVAEAARRLIDAGCAL
jgi:hypothetical protein